MLYKTSRLIGQVLVVVFLLAVLGAQVVSAQTTLPPCTESLISELPNDNDGVEQAVDIDKDGDGLIEICDLEGLYEMRYVLDGSGYRPNATATTNTTGCPTRGCAGFELTRNLNFTNNDSYRMPANRVEYTDGNGWEPIGTLGSRFNTRFEGNGHTISNLRINRRGTDNISLFGVTSAMSNIANIGLRNVRIIGLTNVGGLVGSNNGSITNSYATGSVLGSIPVGGLVGSNGGSIINSYATVSVLGSTQVGGLVGFNFRGSIMNSYATGSVSGSSQVGGLVGNNFEGSITNSYVTGSVKGNERVGGLVGSNAGLITNSYATGSNTLVGSDVGMIMNVLKKTLMELRTPTTATGIYSDWSTDVWDFGTPNDLPTLKDVPEIELIRIRTKVFLEGPLQ